MGTNPFAEPSEQSSQSGSTLLTTSMTSPLLKLSCPGSVAMWWHNAWTSLRIDDRKEQVSRCPVSLRHHLEAKLGNEAVPQQEQGPFLNTSIPSFGFSCWCWCRWVSGLGTGGCVWRLCLLSYSDGLGHKVKNGPIQREPTRRWSDGDEHNLGIKLSFHDSVGSFVSPLSFHRWFDSFKTGLKVRETTLMMVMGKFYTPRLCNWKYKMCSLKVFRLILFLRCPTQRVNDLPVILFCSCRLKHSTINNLLLKLQTLPG